LQKYSLLFFLLFTSQYLIGQKAYIKGTVKNNQREKIQGVSIRYDDANGTTTNANGEYFLEIPGKKDIVLIFSHISYNNLYKKLKSQKTERFAIHHS